MSDRSRRYLAGIAGCLTAIVLTGCSGTEYLGSSDWKLKQEQDAPALPQPQQPQAPQQPNPETNPADAVRATGLDQPSSIAPLPDGTALVAERTSGRVTKVFAQPGLAQQLLYTVPGIDSTGGGGLVALVASPAYVENGLIYAYITTPTEGQVISLNSAGTPKVLVTGLPKASAALTIGADGSLLVATGGTGPLGGKVLSIDPWGDPGMLATNGLIMSNGVENPGGLCTDGTNVYAVDTGTGSPGALSGNAVYKVAGEPTGGSGGMGSASAPIINYTAGKDAGAQGCVVTDLAIITAGTDSQSLATTIFDMSNATVSDPTLSLTGVYGRLRAIAIDPIQGGLWVGTYNRDGIGTPAPDDDRIIYIPPPSGSTGTDVS